MNPLTLRMPPTVFAHGLKGCFTSRSSGLPARFQRSIIPRSSAAIWSTFAGRNSCLGLPMGDCRSATLPTGDKWIGKARFIRSSLTVP